MDPFSAEGELVNIHNAFHQGQFDAVKDFDTSALSASNALPARVLQYRARIQLGEASAVLSDLSGDAEASTADLRAVQVFAKWTQDRSAASSVDAAAQLAAAEADNLSVQLLCGTVLAASERREEALALLARHQGSLDAVAAAVQIQLAQNRLDLATQEVRRARAWAQDSLLVNLAESWVGLREGGERYQAAFYVYEELATAPATTATASLLGQAIAELHLGRLPEAEAAMGEALKAAKGTEEPDVLANAVVLNTILGKAKETAELKERLTKADGQHPLLKELEEKKSLFAKACTKYEPKFEVAGKA